MQLRPAFPRQSLTSTVFNKLAIQPKESKVRWSMGTLKWRFLKLKVDASYDWETRQPAYNYRYYTHTQGLRLRVIDTAVQPLSKQTAWFEGNALVWGRCYLPKGCMGRKGGGRPGSLLTTTGSSNPPVFESSRYCESE